MARDVRYDVIVVGGGSAGVAAAIGAAAAGAHTLLVEAQGYLGGAATHSIVLAWCGFYRQRPASPPERIVRGVADRVLDELERVGMSVEPYYSASGNWNIRLNPEATKLALDRAAMVPNLDVWLHTAVTGVSRSGRVVEALRLSDHRGPREIGAGRFVDCSGDADLTFLAGGNPCPLHRAAHVQPASFPVRITGVARGSALDKAARGQALASVDRQQGRAELRADGGIMTTLPGTDDVWWLAIEVETNGLDGHDLAEAERDGRALAWRGIEALRRHVAGFERANIAATGPKIGIRETRHIATVAPLREADVAGAVKRDDGVALGGWPMEIHHGPGKTEYRPIGSDGSYHVPLGALRAADFDNVWLGGRTVGADPAAYASVRVMGTAFATGHGAGVAAALSHGALRDVQRELARQGARL